MTPDEFNAVAVHCRYCRWQGTVAEAQAGPMEHGQRWAYCPDCDEELEAEDGLPAVKPKRD